MFRRKDRHIDPTDRKLCRKVVILTGLFCESAASCVEGEIVLLTLAVLQAATYARSEIAMLTLAGLQVGHSATSYAAKTTMVKPVTIVDFKQRKFMSTRCLNKRTQIVSRRS